MCEGPKCYSSHVNVYVAMVAHRSRFGNMYRSMALHRSRVRNMREDLGPTGHLMRTLCEGPRYYRSLAGEHVRGI